MFFVVEIGSSGLVEDLTDGLFYCSIQTAKNRKPSCSVREQKSFYESIEKVNIYFRFGALVFA